MEVKQELEQYLNLIKEFRESDNTQECPVKCTLEIIFWGKWKVRILGLLLGKEVVRFNELNEVTKWSNLN